MTLSQLNASYFEATTLGYVGEVAGKREADPRDPRNKVM